MSLLTTESDLLYVDLTLGELPVQGAEIHDFLVRHANRDTLEGDPRDHVADMGSGYLVVSEVVGGVRREDVGQISA